MHTIPRVDLSSRIFQIIAILNSVAVLTVLSVYAYGGFFSRYLADDYCESFLLLSSRNFLEATIKGYGTWFNSYSILFIVQLTDWAGIWGFRLMSALTLLFLTAGLTWLIHEINQAVNLRLHPAVRLWMAGFIVFLSLYQAPSLYQILYWRTSLIPYTMPLIFLVGIAAYILWYACLPFQKLRAVWMGLTCLGTVIFTSGLGETTAALQVGIFVVAFLLTWMTRSLHRRDDLVYILGVSLAGSIGSLLVIAFSPGTITRMDKIMTQSPLYNPVDLGVHTTIVFLQFLWETLRTLPLPHIISILVPFAILYYQFSGGGDQSGPVYSARLRLIIFLVPVLMFTVIGFSFAPSVFVRSFPVARARFASHFVLALSLAIEGGALGLLASRMRPHQNRVFVRNALLVFLAIATAYPLRAAMKIYPSTFEYRNFASAWDARDEYIRRSVSDGAKDLVVVQLDSMGGVGEYKGNERHWINRCAADFYGLDTLRAP